jgi:hypothetical protein
VQLPQIRSWLIKKTPVHFSLDISNRIGYKKKCEAQESFMRTSSSRMSSPQRTAAAADTASRQRQILDRLSAEYAQRVHELLRYRELLKGSVYQMQTRCGNPSCHCAKPRGARHAATVLSWSEAGKTRIRSIAQADRARLRDLTENYRGLRQARAELVKLHQQVLDAVDCLEQVLRLPPPSPSQRHSGI